MSRLHIVRPGAGAALAPTAFAPEDRVVYIHRADPGAPGAEVWDPDPDAPAGSAPAVGPDDLVSLIFDADVVLVW